jgi:hypothetical protein
MFEKVFEHIAKEWTVLKQAPFAFLGLAAVTAAVGYGIGGWYYSGQIANLKEGATSKDALIATKEAQALRYRVALGIDKPSRGVMVELSNRELRAMALNISPKVRDLCLSFQRRTEPLRVTGKNPVEDRKNIALIDSIGREVSEQYERELRADEVLINNEVLRRLDRKSLAAVIRVPIADAETGSPVSTSALMGHTGIGRMDAGLMCMAASETEQLAKLLPDSERQILTK